MLCMTTEITPEASEDTVRTISTRPLLTHIGLVRGQSVAVRFEQLPPVAFLDTPGQEVQASVDSGLVNLVQC